MIYRKGTNIRIQRERLSHIIPFLLVSCRSSRQWNKVKMHFLSICLHTTYVYASKDRHFWEKTLHTQIKTANIRNFIGKHPISFKFLKTAPTDRKDKCREIKQPPNQSTKRLSSYSKREYKI